ncbi:hypothetical protein C0V70_03080 [Bacteriovorax stolpii]|uniref:Uncharacterized protein n=1 Tax=Bacteriovorax stolpii TaxID=960 RepID=A0A2K9NNN5_BACTC|nr:hypothetical protein [Bacteriovorax stolpii]AUN97107.1 hypothetical protein C0V70_03080 [Bacteriovorax stolpii]TDP53392.1 hypothetical protein C8D79_2035 [Bacteriovorax stolpii]
MKIILALTIMILSITNVFARPSCPAVQPQTGVENFAKDAAGLACAATREEYQCAKLESELEDKEKYKVIKCDSKSLEANKLSNVSLSDCVWNGLKISGEQLVDLGKLPGKIAESIAKGFSETQMCNQSIEKKREILNAFNLTIEDSRFKLTEQFLGRWLEEAPCSEIEKLVFNRYQNYQNTMMRERQAAILTGKKPAALKTEKQGPGLMELLKSAMKEAGAVYQCYTPKVKAEMICAGVTSLLADAALGGGVLMAAKKISMVVKSKKALGNIERAVASGNKADLKDSAALLTKDRLKGAQAVLKRELTEAEKKAVMEAHEVGIKEGRGFYSYTQEDISKKARILREAGLSPSETRELMENGITGMFRDPFFKNAMVKHFEKTVALTMTEVQKDAMVAIHELGKSSAAGFADKAKALLKEAKFTDEQIAKILKAKSNEENGIKTVVAAAVEKKTETAATKPVAEVAKPQPTTAAVKPVETPVQAVVDSPGRKAVLSNFKDDKLVQYKPMEIDEKLTGEALEAKKRARSKEAQELIKKLEKTNGFDVQASMYSDAESISKARKFIAEYEEKIAKLPAKGADMTRKDLLDKLDRSKTSLEMYQKRCKGALELYREAYGIVQYLKTYETVYERSCK